MFGKPCWVTIQIIPELGSAVSFEKPVLKWGIGLPGGIAFAVISWKIISTRCGFDRMNSTAVSNALYASTQVDCPVISKRTIVGSLSSHTTLKGIPYHLSSLGIMCFSQHELL